MSWLARLGLHVLVGLTLAVLDAAFSHGRIKQATWVVHKPHQRKFALAVVFEVVLLAGVWLSGNPELLLGLALLIPNAVALVIGIDLAELAMRVYERITGRHRVPRVEVLPPGAEASLPEAGEPYDASKVVDVDPAFDAEQSRRARTRDSLNDKLKGY